MDRGKRLTLYGVPLYSREERRVALVKGFLFGLPVGAVLVVVGVLVGAVR